MPPPGPGKGTPPPGFDGPPGFPTKPVSFRCHDFRLCILRYGVVQSADSWPVCVKSSSVCGWDLW